MFAQGRQLLCISLDVFRTVTVLHQGSVLAEGSMDEVQNNQDVIDVYLGEEH